MNDYKELIEVLNNAEKINLCGNGAFNTVLVERCYEAADAIEQLVRERDELLQERAKRELCINNHVPTAREVARAYDELYY